MTIKIGVTVRYIKADGYSIPFQGVGSSYMEALHGAGALPFAVPILSYTAEQLSNIVNSFDGFVFTGGEDVDPETYREFPHGKLGAVSRKRDDYEIALFHSIFKKRPILAICRGIQLVNVALGGTLYQDIASQCSTTTVHSKKRDNWENLPHEIIIEGDSLLSRAIGLGGEGVLKSIKVNSLHHQAIKDVASGLKVSGRAEDGMIEAVEFEAKNAAPLLAVQWHPEVLARLDTKEGAESRNLFSWLLQAAT